VSDFVSLNGFLKQVDELAENVIHGAKLRLKSQTMTESSDNTEIEFEETRKTLCEAENAHKRAQERLWLDKACKAAAKGAEILRRDRDKIEAVAAFVLLILLAVAYDQIHQGLNFAFTASLGMCKRACLVRSERFFRGDSVKQKQLSIGCVMVECSQVSASKDEWDAEVESWQRDMQAIVEALYNGTK
jgi:hypothetical protein